VNNKKKPSYIKTRLPGPTPSRIGMTLRAPLHSRAPVISILWSLGSIMVKTRQLLYYIGPDGPEPGNVKVG
jgi:hypothetical protein